MGKFVLMIIISALFMSGCIASMVKPQSYNKKQIVIQHAIGWYKEAQQRANDHCSQYGKVANMYNTECGMKNPIHGGTECITIYRCE